MLNTQRFKGTIGDVSVQDFLNKLDDGLSQEERVKLTKDILYTQNNGMLVDKFFEEAFEQKETKNGIDTSHIKLCLNKSDGLATNDYTCRGIEKFANYIVYSPDGERITKKTKYNFYPKDIFERVILNKEDKIEDIVEKNRSKDCESNDEIIDFLIRKGQNFKNEIKQVIQKRDVNTIEVLRNYQDFINHISNMLKELKDNGGSVREQKRLGRLIYDLKDDQILSKDFINGTIYFKQVMSDSTEIDYDKFDYNNKEHVLALLRMGSRTNFDDDLSCMIYDLGVLVKKIDFTKEEKKVMSLWKDNDLTQQDIADELGVTQQYIGKVLTNIFKKISTLYNEEYEDWYYLNVEKGEYKTCTCCKEVKLSNKFGKDTRNKDGLKCYCKACDSKKKRGK